MKVECLTKSRYPGKYNNEFDFAKFGTVRVVEGIADVTDECAKALVATGNFVRVEEFLQPAIAAVVAEAAVVVPDAEVKAAVPAPAAAPKKKKKD